jgi:hypothetical protein
MRSATAVAILLATCVVMQMHTARAAEPEMLRLARSEDGAVVQVRPIDDPGNPYLGQYSDYDRWFWDNYDPNVTADEKKHFGG